MRPGWLHNEQIFLQARSLLLPPFGSTARRNPRPPPSPAARFFIENPLFFFPAELFFFPSPPNGSRSVAFGEQNEFRVLFAPSPPPRHRNLLFSHRGSVKGGSSSHSMTLIISDAHPHYPLFPERQAGNRPFLPRQLFFSF